MGAKLSAITGKFVFEQICRDFKFFYTYNNSFSIKSQLGGSNISCKGDGAKAKICLSDDFCNMEINDLDDLHFSMVIICHELSHYIHRHNDIRSNSHQSKTIEDWADFFSMKILMTLITYGRHTQSIYNSFENSRKSIARIKSIANALGKLVETFYKNTDATTKYSNTLARVGLNAAGINSFLDAYLGINVDRSKSILYIIYTHNKIYPLLFNNIQLKNPMPPQESIETVSDLHKSIQGENMAISNGLRPFLIPYIGTNYNVTPEYRELFLQRTKAIAKDQGFDIDKELGKLNLIG